LKSHFNIVDSALIVGGITLVISFISISRLDETYGKDLDYLENF